ncbi:MAG: hypothetical protein SFV21_04220, partial [Rhodospirillaceae bacterium]|nr:hypothetical protein [Rhodospirillaceae bacterium]
MFDRRSLLGATAAVSSFVAAAFGRGAAAKTNAKQERPVDLEPRGTMGRLERLPNLALESRQEFLTDFRGWVNTDLSRAMNKRAE